LKASRPLLLVGVSDTQVVRSYVACAKDAGFDTHPVGTAGEAEAWLENHDPIAVALDMTSQDAETSCLGLRGTAHLAHVPVIGLATELNDLAFPEMYGWGGDDVIRRAVPLDLVPRLRSLATDAPLQPAVAKGRVVVVDSDRRRRVLYARVLRNANYDVHFAIAAAEALTASGNEAVKLLITNAESGSEEAVDIARRARAEGLTVPIVIAAPPMKMGGVRAAVEGLLKVAVTDGFAPPENLLFVANELGRSGATDGRASARLLFGAVVAFRHAGRDEDAFGCTYNISAGGLYVRTLAPLDRGDDVWMEMRPPRSDRRVRLEGRVVWRRRFGPIESATVPPGFGVQITDGTKGDLSRYEAGYRAFAADTVGT